MLNGFRAILNADERMLSDGAATNRSEIGQPPCSFDTARMNDV
jgi:hypothetical protein